MPLQQSTLDALARALRGIPRDTLMLVELPDGSLRELRQIQFGHTTVAGGKRALHPNGTDGYAAVLLPDVK